MAEEENNFLNGELMQDPEDQEQLAASLRQNSTDVDDVDDAPTTYSSSMSHGLPDPGPNKHDKRANPMTAEQQDFRKSLLENKLEEIRRAKEQRQVEGEAQPKESSKKIRRNLSNTDVQDKLKKRKEHVPMSWVDGKIAFQQVGAENMEEDDQSNDGIDEDDDLPDTSQPEDSIAQMKHKYSIQKNPQAWHNYHGKANSRKKRFLKDPFNFLQPEVKETMDRFNSFGRGFEKLLSAVVRNSQHRILQRGGENADDIVEELLQREEEWKRANREHMRGMGDLLERYGVLSMGSVRVPKDELKAEASKDVIKISDDEEEVRVMKVES